MSWFRNFVISSFQNPDLKQKDGNPHHTGIQIYLVCDFFLAVFSIGKSIFAEVPPWDSEA